MNQFARSVGPTRPSHMDAPATAAHEVARTRRPVTLLEVPLRLAEATGVAPGSRMRIVNVTATPVAIPLEAPIRHSDGVLHQALRTILQVETDVGIVGLGEVGARVTSDRLAGLAQAIKGESPFSLERLRLRFFQGKFYQQDVASLFAAVEMACLDIQGKAMGLPLAELLGGRLRDEVPTIAYVFLREANDLHPAVTTPDEVVAHTRDLVARYGYGTIKLKGGVLAPDDDVELTRALRAAFPSENLRLDPNAIWSVETSLRVARALQDYDLEWLEDPTLGLLGMAEVTHRGGIPTATNMCLTQPREFPQAVALRAVDVLLCDPWYLGGPRSTRQMAAMCETFGVGLGIHAGGGSNELGIGMAMMVHLASTFPILVHAADAMYHHLQDDILVGGPLPTRSGAIAVPTGPGLGVELDQDRLARYAELHRATAKDRPAGAQDPSRPSWFSHYPTW